MLNYKFKIIKFYNKNYFNFIIKTTYTIIFIINRMKLIFYHFLHLYFLTLFEVIFYIYYIMPYEKELIYNLFDLKNNQYTNVINITNFDNTLLNKNCNHYQNELDNSNTKLFNKCIIYIIIINVLLILLFIKDIYQNYNSFCETSTSPKNFQVSKSSHNIISDYKKNDDSGFELLDISNINTNINTKTNNINNTPTNFKKNTSFEKITSLKKNTSFEKITNNIDNYFLVYYYKNSELVKEIFKLIQFIILVGIFEYLFFITIVNKYKIANIHTILCKLIKEVIK